jgi:hypothetical protein
MVPGSKPWAPTCRCTTPEVPTLDLEAASSINHSGHRRWPQGDKLTSAICWPVPNCQRTWQTTIEHDRPRANIVAVC